MSRLYTIGVALAWIGVGFAVSRYLHKNEVDSATIKILALSGAALAALAWPISVPALIAYIGKSAITNLFASTTEEAVGKSG